jgi:hypothetical protein
VGKRGGSFICHGLDQEREGYEENHKVEVSIATHYVLFFPHKLSKPSPRP